MLGGLPKAPSEDSPFVNYNRARDRQRYVLGQMLENKFIDHRTYDQAYYEPIAEPALEDEPGAEAETAG